MKIVIVGGVAGGASAAARARRLSEESDIVVLEKGMEPSFANCGLPYYVGGVIEDRHRLLVAPRELLEQRYRLDVRTRCEVTAIDRQHKVVSVTDLTTGETYQEAYDKLILATGATPFRPPIPGIDGPRVFALRGLEDADALHRVVGAHPGTAVVVGAGFIGLELVENLVHRGVAVTVVELADQILPPWDREMVLPLESRLRERGVRLFTQDSAVRFTECRSGLKIELQSGSELEADFAIVSIGVRPENRLAVAAGLTCGPRGGIVTDRHMQTGDPDIYAVGDVAEVTDYVTGERTQVPLAGPANRQGRIAADHIFGRDSSYRGTQGTSVVGLFDMAIAMTGQSEKLLRKQGLPYEKVFIHPGDHAGYYPGATGMTLKLLFHPQDGRIWGAQGVGRRGVDKRLDVIAMAIQARMTVDDLEEAELCYAPQFGSAKDPVNMLGFVAAGVRRGDHPITHVADLSQDSHGFLLDVRSPDEFARGHIPPAVNIPLEQLRERLAEVPRAGRIVAYCQVGQRGYMATRVLLQAGFDVVNLSGGFASWSLQNQTASDPPVAASRTS